MLESLTPREAKRRTGFQDIVHLLSFVAIVCGGDIDVMTLRHSTATWIKEWIFYCERAYGRSHIRAEDLASDYTIGLKSSRKTFLSKLQLVLRASSRHPKYATHEEDVKLRDTK
jgi:hypothetical protein